MSKSIRISNELAAEAEKAAKVAHRSPPQQIEHRAQIGRVMEPVLSYSAEKKVKEAGRADLDAVLDEVDSGAGIAKTQEAIRRATGSVESTD